MDYQKIIRWSGLLNLIVCALFVIWWGLMGIIVISSGTFNISTLDLVKLNGYQIQSIIGLIACVIAPFGIMGLYLPFVNRLGKNGLFGFLLSCIGIILYGCMQYDETFTWPILANKSPALLGTEGLMSDPAYLSIFIIMGIILALGMVLFGIALWQANIFPRWSVICFVIGAILFGIGFGIMIRTLGLIIWIIGWGRMGYLLWKGKVV